MPIYEYVCEQDGEVVELMRPAATADEPVPDPKGQGRTFKRKFSTFASGSGANSSPGGRSLPISGGSGGAGGCCPCGKNKGSCSMN